MRLAIALAFLLISTVTPPTILAQSETFGDFVKRERGLTPHPGAVTDLIALNSPGCFDGIGMTDTNQHLLDMVSNGDSEAVLARAACVRPGFTGNGDSKALTVCGDVPLLPAEVFAAVPTGMSPDNWIICAFTLNLATDEPSSATLDLKDFSLLTDDGRELFPSPELTAANATPKYNIGSPKLVQPGRQEAAAIVFKVEQQDIGAPLVLVWVPAAAAFLVEVREPTLDLLLRVDFTGSSQP